MVSPPADLEAQLADRRERLVAILVAVASFLLFATYSIVTPLFEASDELWHYPFVLHLAVGNGLPIQHKDDSDSVAPWRQEGSQPPLYYVLAAALTAPFDQSNWRDLRRLNVHVDMGVPTDDGNANAVMHSQAESWPWTRASLAIHIARLFGALLGAMTVWFTYLVACELWVAAPSLSAPSGRLFRLGAAILCACVPMFAFISGSINNDTLAITLSTASLWFALRTIRLRDLRLGSALMSGLLAGAGALSKVSGAGLVGLFGLAALMAWWCGHNIWPDREPQNRISRHSNSNLSRLFKWLGIFVIVTALVCGWWFVRNQILYGDLLGWNAFLDAVGRREPPATLAQLWSEREGFIWAFWGVFGTLNVIMPPLLYDILNGVLLLSGVGLIVAAFHSRVIARSPSRNGAGAAQSLFPTTLAAVWLVVVMVGLLRWSSLTPASQGRLLFPAISVIACALSFGLLRLSRKLFYVVACGVAVMVIIVPFAVIAPTYAQPKNTPPLNRAEIVNATFGGVITLETAEATGQRRTDSAVSIFPNSETEEEQHRVSPGDSVRVSLSWKLLAPSQSDLSVFVHLVDDNEVIVAQRDMHPGQGNIGTSNVSAPRQWSDFYVVPMNTLAATTRVQRTLKVRVGVYDPVTGARLRLPSGEEWIDVTQMSLANNPQSVNLAFSAGMNLISFELGSLSGSPGMSIPVTTTWSVTRQPPENYNLSLQLIDSQARKVGQVDAGPGTQSWQIGSVQTVTTLIAIDPKAPPGVYSLLLVWYLPVSDLPKIAAYDARGQYAGTQIELMRIRVR